ncbi:unnamed protein product [Lathyrus sativus]|nr:unnamed protein product [Lathyrus sativus]
MSVLINGSPTTEFEMYRGLRQGDPLSPFLFLIVAEGLVGLMRNVVSRDKFQGFKFNDFLHIKLLQFVDDTILVCDGKLNNLWTTKAILCGFELKSGLCVNWNKSKVYGINLHADVLRVASNFLACAVGLVPFNFLGIQVGFNPRRKATWTHLVDKVKKRLTKWKGKQMSIGARVVLLNVILTNLSIFQFSFYKEPKGVIQYLIKIQRSFLWDGTNFKNKIDRVSWPTVCKPKISMD